MIARPAISPADKTYPQELAMIQNLTPHPPSYC